jgi:hypothetical protein
LVANDFAAVETQLAADVDHPTAMRQLRETRAALPPYPPTEIEVDMSQSLRMSSPGQRWRLVKLAAVYGPHERYTVDVVLSRSRAKSAREAWRLREIKNFSIPYSR